MGSSDAEADFLISYRRQLLVYLGISIGFLIGLEAFVRLKQGFHATRLELTPIDTHADDDLYKWNRHLHHKGPQAGNLEEFVDHRYTSLDRLYKENLYLASQGNRYESVGMDTDASIQTNNLGFFGSPDMELQKPKNTFRIFLLGASIMELPLDRPGGKMRGLADFLGETLDIPAGTKVEFINASMTATNIEQHIELLKFRLLEMSPDAIIYSWFPRNEMIRESIEAPCSLLDLEDKNNCWLQAQHPAFRSLYFHSLLFRMLEDEYAIFSRAHPPIPPSKKGRQAYLGNFRDKLKEIAQVAKDNNIYLVFNAQMTAFDFLEPHSLPPRKLYSKQLRTQFFPVTIDQIREATHTLNRTIQQVAQETDSGFCQRPTSEQFSASLFFDFVHFNIRGKVIEKIEKHFDGCLSQDPKFLKKLSR